MTDKTKSVKKYPGFFECVNHTRLAVFLEDKPPTLCRNCFKRISGDLTLYLGEILSDYVMLENIVFQHTDQLTAHIKRLDELDEWIERIVGNKAKKAKD